MGTRYGCFSDTTRGLALLRSASLIGVIQQDQQVAHGVVAAEDHVVQVVDRQSAVLNLDAGSVGDILRITGIEAEVLRRAFNLLRREDTRSQADDRRCQCRVVLLQHSQGIGDARIDLIVLELLQQSARCSVVAGNETSPLAVVAVEQVQVHRGIDACHSTGF